MQEKIDLITKSLKDALLDIKYIDQHGKQTPMAKVRCHLLIAALRTTIKQVRDLDGGFIVEQNSRSMRRVGTLHAGVKLREAVGPGV